MSKINCDLINVSICLSDLDPAQFKVLDNGKKYLNCSVLTRKEPDKYGNDLMIAYKKDKGQATVYVPGSAKSVTFQQDAAVTEYKNENKHDDLPF